MAHDADANYAKMKAFHESGNYKIEMRREAHIALELSTHDKICRICSAESGHCSRQPQMRDSSLRQTIPSA